MIYQNRFIYPYTVPILPANSNDLVYFEGGNGKLTDPVTGLEINTLGTIFEFLQPDPLTPAGWYHEGNPIISQDDLAFFACGITTATNSEIDIISAKKTKGLYELRKGTTLNVVSSAPNVTNTIINVIGHGLTPYDKVELIGITYIPDGIYVVLVIDPNNFTINYVASLPSLGVGTMTKVEYFWDEIYTTPLGLYQVIDSTVALSSTFEFQFLSNDSNQLIIRTPDPSIIPKVGDTLCLQKINDLKSFVSGVTTDGINNVPNYSNQETYLFQIQTVSLTSIPAATPLPALYEYTIELDKSFRPMFENAIPGSAEVLATGSFDIPAANTGAQALVLVNGIPISTNVTYLPSMNYFDFRDAIISSINTYNSTPEYTAQALTPTGFTIVITAATGSGSSENGNVVAVTTSGTISITNVVNMNGGVNAGLDTPGDGKYYFVTLLNREGTTVNRELFTDTWQLKEIHRQQLLGDPFEYNGTLQRRGRKNYLNYGGADGLGVQHLLKDIIDTNKTPFIMIEFYDEIKDRIYWAQNEFEIDIPNVMLQGETTDTILINSDPSSPLFDDKGVGFYHGLYLKNGTVSTRYGWVFFDLRIVIIDHAEMVTAMGYNSNRNYTLPEPTITEVGNTTANLIPINVEVFDVSALSALDPIIITTTVPHGLTSNQLLNISGIVGEAAANGNFYISVTAANTFELFSDVLLTTPVLPTTFPVPSTTGGILSGIEFPYQYFLTYRINNAHYDTLPYAEIIPFNFRNVSNANLIDNSSTGLINLNIAAFNHLVDSVNVEGFNAETLQLIIGAYDGTVTSSGYSVTGIKDVVVMDKVNLKTATVQNLVHSLGYSLTDYQTKRDDITTAFLYNLKDNPYERIYSINPVPANLFTGNNKWFLGNTGWKSQISKKRLTLEVTIEANKWNGTTNPSFITGDSLMDKKLISEIAFLIKDENLITQSEPYIYGKISPPIQKDNESDIRLQVTLDF